MLLKPTSVQTLTKAFASVSQAAEAPQAGAPKPATRTAIFGVHGISPHQRYDFQDQIANALLGYLNASEAASNSGKTWKATVWWPHFGKGFAGTPPSATRLHYTEDSPQAPAEQIYDIYEGYWSPLSKGKTTLASAFSWLLSSIFLGLSSTASIPCDWKKLRSDLGYVLRLLLIVLGLGGAALTVAYLAWASYSAVILPASEHVSFGKVLSNPIASMFSLPTLAYVELGLEIVAAYLIAQLYTILKRSMERNRNKSAVKSDASKGGHFEQSTIRAEQFHMYAGIAVAMTTAIACALAVFVATRVGNLDWRHFWNSRHFWASVGVAVSVMAINYVRSVARGAVENVLGDIQIYTTHDNNSTFYSIRGQIVQAVCGPLMNVLRIAANPDDEPEDRKPFYDHVHIFGHSLGSTVAMDALISVRQMVQADPLVWAQWDRIRSFVTFGTALEKTRFFFNVRKPTINAAQDQWEDDVYGRFFTNDRNALTGQTNAKGIYWTNLWYLQDIVANEIVTYKSDVNVGTDFAWAKLDREICENIQLTPADTRWYAWVHGDYLGDPNFWAQVGPIVTT